MCKSVTNKPCYMHSVTCLYPSTWKVEAELGAQGQPEPHETLSSNSNKTTSQTVG